MKRENTVRSGAWPTSCSMAGSTRGIHGVAQGPAGANRFCMSMHKWTAFDPTGAINLPMFGRPLLPDRGTSLAERGPPARTMTS